MSYALDLVGEGNSIGVTIYTYDSSLVSHFITNCQREIKFLRAC